MLMDPWLYLRLHIQTGYIKVLFSINWIKVKYLGQPLEPLFNSKKKNSNTGHVSTTINLSQSTMKPNYPMRDLAHKTNTEAADQSPNEQNNCLLFCCYSTTSDHPWVTFPTPPAVSRSTWSQRLLYCACQNGQHCFMVLYSQIVAFILYILQPNHFANTKITIQKQKSYVVCATQTYWRVIRAHGKPNSQKCIIYTL